MPRLTTNARHFSSSFSEPRAFLKVNRLTLGTAVQAGGGGERPLRPGDEAGTEDHECGELAHHSCSVEKETWRMLHN